MRITCRGGAEASRADMRAGGRIRSRPPMLAGDDGFQTAPRRRAAAAEGAPRGLAPVEGKEVRLDEGRRVRRRGARDGGHLASRRWTRCRAMATPGAAAPAPVPGADDDVTRVRARMPGAPESPPSPESPESSDDDLTRVAKPPGKDEKTYPGGRPPHPSTKRPRWSSHPKKKKKSADDDRGGKSRSHERPHSAEIHRTSQGPFPEKTRVMMATERDAKAQGLKRINFFKGFSPPSTTGTTPSAITSRSASCTIGSATRRASCLATRAS